MVAKVGHQRLGEALHGELRGAVGGVRHARHQRGPEAVGAGGVDDVALVGAHQHRQERPARIVDAEPVDLEDTVPLLPVGQHEAAAAADARVVEEQVDAVGVVLARHVFGEAPYLRFVSDVGDVAGEGHALRAAVGIAKARGLRHVFGEQIAHRHAGALRHQLAHQLAAHARAAAGDDGELACEILHPFLLVGPGRQRVQTVRETRTSATPGGPRPEDLEFAPKSEGA